MPSTSTPPWIHLFAETAGNSHIQRGIPCQDKAQAWLTPFPALAVLDGRGSAKHSELGSQAGITSIQRTLNNQKTSISKALNIPLADEAAFQWKKLAQRFYRNALSTQIRLARNHKTHPKDYEFTMSCMVVGESWIGWLTIGDSPLVVINQGIAAIVAEPVFSRYANETTFVSISDRQATAMQCGIIPTAGTQALYAMSDGAASGFIQESSHTPAPALTQLIPLLQQYILNKHHHPELEHSEKQAQQKGNHPILEILEQDSWNSATGDDRALATLISTHDTATNLSQYKQQHPTCHPPTKHKPKQLIYNLEATQRNNHHKLLFPHSA